MPFCMNQECGKQELKRTEIELDPQTQEVLCRECYYQRYPTGDVLPAASQIGEPEREFTYGVHLTSANGLQARVAYGGNFVDLNVPRHELAGLAGKLLR